MVPEERKELWDDLLPRCSPLSEVTERFGTGVQTGKDPLLVLDPTDPRLNEFGTAHFRDAFKGRDVRRYIAEPSKRMFFPYASNGGKFEIIEFGDLAPPLRSYLSDPDIRQSLESRLWFKQGPVELSGRWYGLMFVDHPWTFEQPHLLTPGISDRSNFAMGDGSVFVTGTAGVNSVVLSTEINESPFYVLAVLNSGLISRYIIDHSTPYQGGYFKFSTNYIKESPLHRIDFTDPAESQAHDDIVSLAKGITSRKLRMKEEAGADLAASEKVIKASEARIDEIVLSLYGLPPSVTALISV